MLAGAVGCSTVIKTSSDDAAAVSQERGALVEAASAAAWSPWPKPSSSSFADRLAGAEIDGDRISRDDAIGFYVSLIKDSGDAEAALMNDAKRHLDAARRLDEVTTDLCDTARPRLSDVALVEDAIADLRETRTIYLAALKRIDAEKSAADRLKRDFDTSLKELGETADRLAQNAMKRRAEAYLAPRSGDRASGAY